MDCHLFSSSWLTDLLVHLLQSRVSDGSLPMLGVTIAKKGRIVFSASASSTDSGSGALHPGETILRIYSMTKPITSVAALILIGMFKNHSII